jgi:cysteine-rich repeat protein
LDEGEACDEGEENSDVDPNACRTSCVLSTCGDGVVDDSETCDDGAVSGGDGCSGGCLTEAGSPEIEPNDSAWSGQPATSDEVFHGQLNDFDLDCFRYSVQQAGWIEARVLPDADEACLSGHTLTLRTRNGTLLAWAFSSEFSNRCAVLDVYQKPGAQFLAEGDYAICIEGTLGSPVNSYALVATVGDSSCDMAFTDTPPLDFDGDGVHNWCDDDDDGDGINDDLDNCPLVANTLDSDPWTTSNKGFIDHWLISGPYTGTISPDQCEPATQSVTYFQDGSVTPAIADQIPGVPWRAAVYATEKLNFFNYFTSTSPHEAYAVSWVNIHESREVILAMGADDGFRVWVDGEQIASVPTCQGVLNDEYKYPMMLTEGWHRLTIRVRDHGGSWGLVARFLDAETEEPLTDLEMSLHPYGAWEDDQTDSDGDGMGDVCDPAPNNASL